MTLLLDTHVFLWWDGDDRRLRAAARTAIASAERIVISLASAWECAIKIGQGRLRLADSFATAIERNRFDVLPIVLAHVERVTTLPRHHADPFDRMLIAQALVEGLTLVTHDRRLQPYDMPVIWA